MDLAHGRDDACLLMKLIGAAEVWLAVALANVEGDEDLGVARRQHSRPRTGMRGFFVADWLAWRFSFGSIEVVGRPVPAQAQLNGDTANEVPSWRSAKHDRWAGLPPGL